MLASPRLIASATVLLTTTLWSMRQVLTKFGLADLSPLTIIAGQATLGALLLGALLFGWRRERLPHLTLPEWARVVGTGLLGFVFSQTLMIVALTQLATGTLAFVLSFTAIAALVLGIIMLRDWPTPLQLIGLICAFAGAYLFFPIRPTTAEVGAILILCIEMFAISLADNLIRDLLLRGRITAMMMALVTMVAGALILVPVALWNDGVPATSGGGLLAIVYGGIAINAIAIPLWNHALKTLAVFEAAVLTNLGTIEVVFLGWVLLGETLTPRMALAVTVVLVGVSLVQLRSWPQTTWLSESIRTRRLRRRGAL